MKSLFNYAIKLLNKYKSIVLYLFFGVATTVINILAYTLFAKLFKIDYLISNIIAWVLAVVFAYITNKLYVFNSKSFEKSIFIKEITSFTTARLFSLAVDMGIMYVFVGLLGANDIIIKIISNIIVIVMNYIFSKWFIFKK